MMIIVVVYLGHGGMFHPVYQFYFSPDLFSWGRDMS